MITFPYPTRSSPVSALARLQEELGRAFGDPLELDLGLSGRGAFPPLSVFSNGDGATVRFELPGLAPEDLSVEVAGNTLTVSGKREPLVPAEGNFQRRERWVGEFRRSLTLPQDLDLAKVTATHEHGVLTVHVPKRAEARSRQIAVKSK